MIAQEKERKEETERTRSNTSSRRTIHRRLVRRFIANFAGDENAAVATASEQKTKREREKRQKATALPRRGGRESNSRRIGPTQHDARATGGSNFSL